MGSSALMLPNPCGETVRIVFYERAPNLIDTIFLQAVRKGLKTGEDLTAKAYATMAPFYATRLAGLVTALESDYAAVAAAPSSRPDVDVYRVPLAVGKLDLSARFSRKGIVKAASATSVEQLVDEFSYDARGDEPKIGSLVIVDDIVASGRTLAALVLHLRRAGLSSDCRITVAAAAWMPSVNEATPVHPA